MDGVFIAGECGYLGGLWDRWVDGLRVAGWGVVVGVFFGGGGVM